MLARHIQQNEPNRGPRRYFLPMPFETPCFIADFFLNPQVLEIVQAAMGDRVVADQWGCDVPLRGSDYQAPHADYQRPLFAEVPDLLLPMYVLVVSFGLVDITAGNGPIEIAPGTHLLPPLKSAEVKMVAVNLDIGDVLIRHPRMLHRGTPNRTDTPRALASIRYVRRWYVDDSREVNPIPRAVWDTLTEKQQSMMRFPLGDSRS